jgi:hypothetical protein
MMALHFTALSVSPNHLSFGEAALLATEQAIPVTDLMMKSPSIPM